MMNYIGNLSVFDHSTQQWSIFKGRLEQFIKLNGVKDESKSALLITHLSDDTYSLARNLLHPQTLDKIKFEDLVKELDKYFSPRRCLLADREKFYEARRATGESVEEWAARVRGLAVHCEFEGMLEQALRDRFVLGIGTGAERDRLFEMDATKLSFSKALEVAQQAASARQARQTAAAGPARVKEEPVYWAGAGAGAGGARGGPRPRPRPAAAGDGAPAPHEGSRCTICGLRFHDADKCRYKNYHCQSCGAKGHLKKVCKKKVKVHSVNIEDSDQSGDTCEDCKECKLFNLRYVNYDPILVSVLINNMTYNMELDSGSSVSVMSSQMYNEHFSNRPLSSCNLKMCFYNGHKIAPLGFLSLTVQFDNATHDIMFYVIQNGGPPLLGRDFMSKFKVEFSTNKNVNYVKNQERDIEVQQLMNEYGDLWKNELGCFNKFEINLHLKPGSKPRFFKPRTVPFALKDKVEDELNRLVQVGILVPVSCSEFATPIVPVLKENGKVRIADDFSVSLNKDLHVDKYPMPRIEEVFAKLGGGEKYSKIDLSSAYNQFKLSESSQDLTTISTSKGLFKYTRLVYGLANAPALFQNAMETLLAGIDGVSIWLDDICCTGPDRQTHLSRLREVLTRLKDAGLRLQREKCVLFQDSVTYLGYVIDKHGLHTNPDKVTAIRNAPEPTNVTEVKRFLGVVNYYRNFIPNASSILSPLHELFRSSAPWEWGARQRHAFEQVKRELASERVLVHFDPSARLVLTVDAGPAGLGAVLAHVADDGQERPLAFASRSLSESEKNYSQVQKEATAIIFGVKRFHQYLFGRNEPFILKTDHKPLISIFNNKNGISVTTAARLQRYALILSAYNYIVQYTSGENNIVADYFSRAPVSSAEKITVEESSNFSVKFLHCNVDPILFEDIKVATCNDSTLQTVMKYMKNGWPRKVQCKSIHPYFQCKMDLQVEDGCLLRGHRTVIPSVYRKRMLQELHSTHLGITKTKSMARSRMWWPGIDGDIERYVGSCEKCAAVRSAPPRAPPASWPQPTGPWQRIHIDYLSVGQRVYLVVIDAFSKWLECIYMNNGTSTHALIGKLKYLFSLFGLPYLIVSDNDVKINSAEFIKFCSNNGVKYVTSPVYHPCSNGQAENSVKTCKKMLKCILSDYKSTEQINEQLLDYLFSYRNTVHCTTGVTPAKLMLGREFNSRLDLILPQQRSDTCESEKLPKCRQFQLGDVVWARWFCQRKSQWTLGVIKKKLGNRMFEILIKNEICKRHVDQLIHYTGQNSRDLLNLDDTEESERDQTAQCSGLPLCIDPSSPPQPQPEYETIAPPEHVPNAPSEHVPIAPRDDSVVIDRDSAATGGGEEEEQWSEALEANVAQQPDLDIEESGPSTNAASEQHVSAVRPPSTRSLRPRNKTFKLMLEE